MLRVALLVFSLIIVSTFLVVKPEDKVVFLNVGQGDSILLQQGTRQVLVDGGPGMDVLEELSREMPWFDRRVEVLVLSHPQKDHMEGLLHVLERYEVGLILLPEAAASSQMQEAWIKMILSREIPWRFAREGQRLLAGDLVIDVLAPLNNPEVLAAIKSDVNNASVVLRVGVKSGEKGRNLSFLLTGDAEKRIEKMLVERYREGELDVEVMKAGHHGSKTSSTAELIEAVSPMAAVFTVGEGNSFGHPAKEVLDRFEGMPIFRTDEQGAVSWIWSGDSWMVKTGSRAGR